MHVIYIAIANFQGYIQNSKLGIHVNHSAFVIHNDIPPTTRCRDVKMSVYLNTYTGSRTVTETLLSSQAS